MSQCGINYNILLLLRMYLEINYLMSFIVSFPSIK